MLRILNLFLVRDVHKTKATLDKPGQLGQEQAEKKKQVRVSILHSYPHMYSSHPIPPPLCSWGGISGTQVMIASQRHAYKGFRHMLSLHACMRANGKVEEAEKGGMGDEERKVGK